MSNTKDRSIRRLSCACCGEETYGRQWLNQDTGYGVCERCADANDARFGEGTPEDGLSGRTTRALYGVRGFHFDVEEGEQA